jgi:K+-sensing histidine kinase KdpD
MALVAAVSGGLALLERNVGASTVAGVYLFAVLPVAVIWPAALGVLAAVASTAAYDFLFTPPRHSLTLATHGTGCDSRSSSARRW